jgi:hypothetical protein
LKRFLMVHRHPTFYRILGLVFLCSTMALIFLSTPPAWPSPIHAALFTHSVFFLVAALSYFHLGNQEERGF